MTEDGKSVQERFELLLLLEMGLTPSDLEEYDYHTVNCNEHAVPDDFLEEPEDDEDEEEEGDGNSESDRENEAEE